MSLAQDAKIRELEERVSKLETLAAIQPHKEEVTEVSDFKKLWGEIKTIKMRMARDGKRTLSTD